VTGAMVLNLSGLDIMKGVFFLPVDVFLIIGVLLNDGVSVLDVLRPFFEFV
jgi:hypothetical protein